MTQFDLLGIVGGVFELPRQGALAKPDPGIIAGVEFRNLALFKLSMLSELARRYTELEAALLTVQQFVTAQLDRHASSRS